MRSRAIISLLRGQAAHPAGSTFTFAYGAPSMACTSSASSSSGLLPTSPPPSLGIFGPCSQEYVAAQGHLREEVIKEQLELRFIHLLGDFESGGGSRNESRKLRDLITEKLYEPTEVTTSSLAMISDKLIKHPFRETWSAPRQPLARSFSSDCKYGLAGESEDSKRTADAVEQMLEVNKQILKFLQDNLGNNASKTAPRSTASATTDLETVKPQGPSIPSSSTVYPAGPLGSAVLVVLSGIESVVKVLQEWVPKDSRVQVLLVMLAQSVSLAKDPAAKAALDNLMEDRNIWTTLKKKGKTAEEKSTEGILFTESNAKKLQRLRHIVEEYLGMVERHQAPLAIGMTLVILGYILAQVSW